MTSSFFANTLNWYINIIPWLTNISIKTIRLISWYHKESDTNKIACSKVLGTIWQSSEAVRRLATYMGSGRAGRPKTPHQIWPRTGRLCTDCRPARRNNERLTKQLEKLYYKVHCSPTRKLCIKLTCNVNCLGTIGPARAITNKPENSPFSSVWSCCSLQCKKEVNLILVLTMDVKGNRYI